jgi:hypothetical protein
VDGSEDVNEEQDRTKSCNLQFHFHEILPFDERRISFRQIGTAVKAF